MSSSNQKAPLAFVDTETTHLSAELGEVWEVAIILRDGDGDGEHVWQFTPRTIDAEIHGEALRIGRFEERFAVPDGCTAAYTADGDIDPMTRDDAITEITATLSGAVLVANNAAFDDRHLRKLLDLREEEQPWCHRPTCIMARAEGYLWATDPHWMAEQEAAVGQVSSRVLSRRLGVEPPGGDVAHTALGDARWVMAVHDAITAPRVVRAWADDEIVTCSHNRCSNGEGYSKATERGWTTDRVNNWLCQQHPIGGAA
ncbi:MAG: hypothetical protein HOW97_02470 [Catenulispora sp.]|nr:hypothetical protein [Catenulispora sp.]